MPRFLVVIDTPGIKQFVFGTDPLAEVRGASALLDRLNRRDTESELASRLQAAGARLADARSERFADRNQRLRDESFFGRGNWFEWHKLCLKAPRKERVNGIRCLPQNRRGSRRKH